MSSSASDPYYLEKAQIRAFSQRGVCLSSHCSGADDILDWRCEQGHQWHEQLGKVLRGNWCPACEHCQPTDSATQNGNQ